MGTGFSMYASCGEGSTRAQCENLQDEKGLAAVNNIIRKNASSMASMASSTVSTFARRNLGRIAGLGLISALTLSASAQISVPINKCWEKSSAGGSEGWLARTLSVGNQGSEVFTLTGPLIDYTRIYSAYDTSPPQAMLHSSSIPETQRHRVDSASNTDVHVSLYDMLDQGTIGNLRKLVVKKYSASNLDWTYNFPVQTNGHKDTFVAVSNDGETILAAAKNIFNGFSFDIAFLKGNYSSTTATTTPVHFSPTGIFKSFGLSADGSTFFIAGSSGIQVGNTATRAITHNVSVPFVDSFRSKVVISGSGRFLAYATDSRVRILERTSSTYTVRYTYDIPGSYSYESHLDFSENDALLACGINYPPDLHLARVVSFDVLASGGPRLLHTDLLTGGGDFDDRISDVSAAANGNRFVVGTWGDDQNLIPEVLVYGLVQSRPVGTVDLPGSVWDLDMAADGKSFAVGFKHLHANVFASTTASYSLYDVGDRDFYMRGAPQIGNTLEFSLKLRPGSVGRLVIGPENPNYTPANYLGLGISYVDPSSWTIRNLGYGDANNMAIRSFPTNGNLFAGLAGQTIHFQGLALGRRKFSANWVKATMVP